jgi:hypothetical protein
MVLKRGLEW